MTAESLGSSGNMAAIGRRSRRPVVRPRHRPAANASRLATALAAVLCWFQVAVADVSLAVTGPEEVVFDWSDHRCDTWDVPDSPARAFRDAAGMVRLFAAHHVARAFVGPDLGSVRRVCDVVFTGGGNNDPDAYDDHLWLAGFWTADGARVYALASAEFHGHRRPGLCSTGAYMACWRNGIVQALSTDGGRGFRRDGGIERAAVAMLPYPYDGAAGRPTGYFAPSNIIAKDGHLFAFVFAGGYRGQQRGACLLRTDRIEDPQRWRAWDGEGFRIDFRLPSESREVGAPQPVCAPVAGLPATVRSVVRIAGGDTFVAVFAATLATAGQPAPVTGIYTAQSRDLLSWSAPKLLLAVPLMYAFGCGDKAAYSYPSLLDADSPSRTFETIGRSAFLYMTRFNTAGCRLTPDRDLIRLPVTVRSGSD